MVVVTDKGDQRDACEALMVVVTMMMAPRHPVPAEEMRDDTTKQLMHRSRLADTSLQ